MFLDFVVDMLGGSVPDALAFIPYIFAGLMLLVFVGAILNFFFGSVHSFFFKS